MGKREIPRGLRDVADLLKHPAISQDVKQQLLAQLSPEDLATIGYKPPKPAPLVPAVQPTTIVELRQVSAPPPLKLVTSWPIEVEELEPAPCADEEFKEEETAAGSLDRIQSACSKLSTSKRGLLVVYTQKVNSIAVSIALSWPIMVIAVALLLLTIAGFHTTFGDGG